MILILRKIGISAFFFLLSFIGVADLPAEVDWKTVGTDAVIVEEVKSDTGIPGVRAYFLVKASRERIWSTLLDYDNFPYIYQGIERMRILNQDQNGARIEFWVDAVLTNLHYILQRDYAEPGHRLEWRKVSGDLKQISGSWEIHDTDYLGKKLLIYNSYVDIGFSLVSWAVRQGAKTKAKEMGYRLREWIESK